MPLVIAREDARQLRLSYLGLTLLGLAFHVPRLFRPLGDLDGCAGPYFGVFFRNYEAFGFGELRGMALWRQLVPVPQAGEPYLHHPPGTWWTMYALGGAEWSMRLPTIVAAIVAACLLCRLLARPLGHWAARFAGASLLATPVMAVYCQLSYEPIAIAFGLGLVYATIRVRDAIDRGTRVRWMLAQGALAFVGTWMDWSFGMFCFGLAAFACSKSISSMFLQLVTPAIAAGVAVVTVVAWQKWALESPLVVLPPTATGSIDKIVEETILSRPAWGKYLAAIEHWMRHTVGLPMLVTAIVGIVPLFARAPRIATALLVTGVAHFGIFAQHAVQHPHFFCLTSPFVAAAAGAAVCALWRRVPRISAFLASAVLIATWVASIELDASTSSTFHRDIGRVLTEATIVRDADGRPTGERIGVMTNFAPIWPYYVTDPHVLVVPPVTNLSWLESVHRDERYRYLWLVVEKPPGVPWNDPLDPDVRAFLERFPRTRVPELEYHMKESGFGWDWNIREAWLVDVPKAE
ncbi:MAG: glycosyltransferase family 39 protein [Planctomycetes bacterium]|nr:glycosyltransferase family 39 protein [Planctomycetota bacterium]